jgi:hypothetical protein
MVSLTHRIARMTRTRDAQMQEPGAVLCRFNWGHDSFCFRFHGLEMLRSRSGISALSVHEAYSVRAGAGLTIGLADRDSIPICVICAICG